MITILAFIAIYIIGVILSIIMIAYINVYEEGPDVPTGLAVLSWLFFIATLLLIIILYPFNNFYKMLVEKFKERKYKK